MLDVCLLFGTGGMLPPGKMVNISVFKNITAADFL